MMRQFKSTGTYVLLTCLGIAVAGLGFLRVNATSTAAGADRQTASTAATPPRAMGREPPPPTVIIDVADLSTGVGAKPLRIILNNATRPVTDEMLGQVAARASLRTWPAMDSVSSEMRMHASDGVRQAYVEVVPKEALKDHWYALRVDPLPAPLAWPRLCQDSVAENGAHMARFRITSNPIVRGARLVDKADGRQLRIEFSEPVIVRSPLEAMVGRSKGLDDCAVLAPANSFPQAEVRLACTGKVIDKEVEVVIGHGLQSSSGAALEGGSPLVYMIGPAEWTGRPDGTWWAVRRI